MISVILMACICIGLCLLPHDSASHYDSNSAFNIDFESALQVCALPASRRTFDSLSLTASVPVVELNQFTFVNSWSRYTLRSDDESRYDYTSSVVRECDDQLYSLAVDQLIEAFSRGTPCDRRSRMDETDADSDSIGSDTDYHIGRMRRVCRLQNSKLYSLAFSIALETPIECEPTARLCVNSCADVVYAPKGSLHCRWQFDMTCPNGFSSARQRQWVHPHSFMLILSTNGHVLFNTAATGYAKSMAALREDMAQQQQQVHVPVPSKRRSQTDVRIRRDEMSD